MPLISRRHFIAALGSTAAVPFLGRAAFAAKDETQLTVDTRVIEVRGKAAKVYRLDTAQGKQGFNFDAGQSLRLSLTNRLSEPTLVHWHGQTPPTEQDGVPMLSQPELKPGESYSYDFKPRAGTHWMHSHVGLQEQKLLAAPMIVRSRADVAADEQEHVVLLHDFTFREPAEILAELKAGGGDHAAHSGGGMSGMGNMSGMDHSKMAMPAPDAGAMLNDITFDAFLANERTLDDPEVVKVEKGGRVRLRIINGAAATNMWVDLGGLEGEFIAVDGNEIEPVKEKVFPLGIAQRADIRVTLPGESGAWPILFRPEGLKQRTGIVLVAGDGTIAKIGAEGDMAPAVDLAMELRLRALKGLAPEPITRAEMVMLTGGDKDYVWGLNGKASMHDTLFTVRHGERIGIMMHNMTTMSHPMHLHGHHFQVVDINGQKVQGAMRDTLLVPPNAMVTIAFDADNPGNWAFHCHHLYHMNAGMMAAVAYVNAA
ncbi:multicopper oxidase family protein [Aestuariivirga sp. YIM B02566]|uniref:Multicopper oxidase family protein n=1 Tax=Taklimakanibacter albus TaxID=2800327 RepID=A0ACC5R689_9HYPH|nr:multicopper oxidase family protein [Aestuariivirga sp. YIM B02566]MBK1868159.1 multicopper oxidase family protein [Aestuariivirga sp. YIM B02566]